MLELFVIARSCEKVQSENNMADLGRKALENDTNDRHMEKLRCVRSGKMTHGRVVEGGGNHWNIDLNLASSSNLHSVTECVNTWTLPRVYLVISTTSDKLRVGLS